VSVAIAQLDFVQAVGQARVEVARKIILDLAKRTPIGVMFLRCPLAGRFVPGAQSLVICLEPVFDRDALGVGVLGPLKRADGDEGKGAVHVGSNLPGFTPNALAIRISIVTVVSLCPVSRFVM